MKKLAFPIALAALAFSAVTHAQVDTEPAKCKSPSMTPELRPLYGCKPLPGPPPKVDVAMLARNIAPDPPGCAAIKANGPVTFRGRTLVEIPDIGEPELKLANRLMSSGCFEGALKRLDAVTKANPENRNAKYILARLTWMVMGPPLAETVLNDALAAHPDFTSAKVLLAGMRYNQQKLDEVVRLLDEAEPKSPSDLWIFLNRMRVEVFRNPSRDVRTRALEIARNPAFPPNAREEAQDIAKHAPNQTPKEFEEVLRVALDIDSSVAMACKASELAFWLSESQGRFADVITLLESPRMKQGNCLGLARNRMLLAQAYLMEAAKISAGPSPQNQHLTKRADAILNGDYTSISAHVTGRPQAAKLQPFLAAYVHPDEEDAHGSTALCNAISQLNTAAVRTQLEAGADVNGRCRNESLVGSLVFMATIEKDDRRRDVMRALLEHGAPIRASLLTSCASKDNGDCHEVLLPLMQQYAKKNGTGAAR
jgi:hypothetical protein